MMTDNIKKTEQKPVEKMFSGDDYPIKVGFNAIPPTAHYHQEIEFWIVLSGRGEYFVSDRAYQLETGSGIIIHGDEIHYGIPGRSEGVLRAVMFFDTRLVKDCPAAQEALKELNSRTHFFLSQQALTAAEFLFREISDEFINRTIGWQDIIRCDLERFLLIIRRSDDVRPPAIVNNRDSELVQSIIKYLESHKSMNISQDEIARHFGVSVSSMQRAFKQVTGGGIKEFTIRLRVVEAKKQLEHTDNKIAAVAYNVGFENLSAFNRDFKIQTGVSPSEYRRLVCKI